MLAIVVGNLTTVLIWNVQLEIFIQDANCHVPKPQHKRLLQPETIVNLQ